MLSVGWTEMMVIAALALIVVGPRDLPAMLRQIGRAAGTIRRMGNDFKNEINKVTALDEVRDIKKSVTEPFKQTKRDITSQFNAISPDGTVKPTGVLAPSDPKAQSVVNEIHSATGMPVKLDAETTGKNVAAAAAIKTKPTAAVATPPVKKPSRRRTAKTKTGVAAEPAPKTKRAVSKKAAPASGNAAAAPRQRRTTKTAEPPDIEAPQASAAPARKKPAKPRKARPRKVEAE